MNLRYTLGIDIAKQDFKVCLLFRNDEGRFVIKGSKTFENTTSGFSKLSDWYNKKINSEYGYNIVMEATGVYHEALAWYLFNKDEKVCVVLANRARAFMNSIGHKSKNDPIDAKGLASMGLSLQLELWQPISKKIYKLRALTRHLEDLYKMETTLRCQKSALNHAMHPVKEVIKSIEMTLKTIHKQIDSCKKKIEKCALEDEVLSKKIEYMTSVKGVGVLTAVAIIAETNGFALIRNQKQLASYAGYDIKENQSGKWQGKTRITKKGNAHIRRAMHMPALNMVRFKVIPYENLYNRIYDKSNIKMKGYVAVQVKLLKLMYTLWKKEEYYQENYNWGNNVLEKR